MNYYFAVFKKYAVFEGRAERKEFWYFRLFDMLVATALWVVDNIFPTTTGSGVEIPVLFFLYSLATFIPNIAVGVRRLHDSNHSGYWWLITLIPIIGPLLLLVDLIKDSTPGENKYGPNPKGIKTVN